MQESKFLPVTMESEAAGDAKAEADASEFSGANNYHISGDLRTGAQNLKDPSRKAPFPIYRLQS
jgi:hypothetical protein